jgi:hypothetical protein
MTSICRLTFAMAVAFALAIAPSAFANNDDELRAQQEKQRAIQAETDQAVQRITTMLRVMKFYGIDSPEKKLEEMSDTLNKLSKNQMADVIRQLENAVEAKTEKQSDEAYQKAHASHLKVLDALHEMVARFDAVKTLDEAALRFEDHAKTQLKLHLRSGQALRDLVDSTKPDLAPIVRDLLRQRLQKQGTEIGEQTAHQNILHRDVNILVKQVHELSSKLNSEQQARVQAMDKLLAETRLLEHLTQASQRLGTKGAAVHRTESFKFANELQWTSANEMQEISRMLRVPGDTFAVLKAARAKIEDAINRQEVIKDEIKIQQDKKAEAEPKKEVAKGKDDELFPGLETLPKDPPAKQLDPRAEREKALKDAVNAEKNAKLAEKQTQIAFDTKDTANILKPLAPDAAKALDAADKEMKATKENLLKNDAKKAAEPQAKAADNLKDAKAQIDRLIAAEEKAKSDPLAAVQKALENIDKIIQDQTKTRDDTKDTVADKQNLKLPELADAQKELAKKTDEVKNTPLPNKDKVEKALNDAAKEMKAAAKNLDAQKSPEAVAKQDKALDALKEARNELAEKAAEIEKRQADIAKLEDAANKLDQLAKDEKNVAKQADKNADQARTDAAANKELAKEQGQLTPKANELAKEIDKAAPKAAEKIGESVKNMEAAKKDLDKNAAKPAAKEAKEAAKKLDDAQKALENALADLKGKQAADEIALQKNTDPDAAAKQIAEAIKEAQKAVDASREAQKAADNAKADPMKGDPMAQDAKANLAKQQADIAKQAVEAKLPEAAKDAAKAAEAIKNGDIPKALENQAKALQQLQEAAKSDPMAKGDPMKAEAKQPGEAKGADPMAKGDPMKGDAKPADPNQAGEKGDPMAKAKGDQPMAEKGDPMAKAKGDKGQGGDPMAKGEKGQAGQPSPDKLAQQQKALMDATKALGQSQEATQAAQAALAQAQAQAPQAVQPALQDAQKQLQQAQENLQKGQPGDAGQNQQQAADKLGQAQQALEKALAQGEKAGEQQAKADGKAEKGMGEKGMGEGEKGMGEGEKGMGEGEKGMGDAQGKNAQAVEKNDGKGDGNRKADGTANNKKAETKDNAGEGSFMHLPPRQRELIRQAMSGNLPPEYANLIQQYYINIARGRPATGAAPTAPPPPR